MTRQRAIAEAREAAEKARAFADRGKDNAALSYLALAMEKLCAHLERQGPDDRGRAP